MNELSDLNTRSNNEESLSHLSQGLESKDPVAKPDDRGPSHGQLCKPVREHCFLTHAWREHRLYVSQLNPVH